jgi:hypothetical protein
MANPKQIIIQRQYRERKRESDRERDALAIQAANLAKALRFAADQNIIEARRFCADTDKEILNNLEVHFYEAAQARLKRNPVKSHK